MNMPQNKSEAVFLGVFRRRYFGSSPHLFGESSLLGGEESPRRSPVPADKEDS